MLDRFSPRVLLLLGLALPIAGCTNSQVDSLAVSPTSDQISVGQTAPFTATATTGHGSNHPATTSNVTTSATWTSSNTTVATVNASGVATALAPGTVTITATMNGYTGVLSASATLTVAGAGSGSGTVSGITGISIIPGSQAVAVPGETSQFFAIGTTSGGATVNMTTNGVSWYSSSTQIATIGANGLATAMTAGSTTIVALYTNPGAGGSTITGTATFTVAAGSTEKYTAVSIIPGSQTVSASGQTTQLIALATSGTTGLEVDVTNSAQTTWNSSVPSYATVTNQQPAPAKNGVVTGVSPGTTTITAEVTNPDGSTVSNIATITTTNTAAPEPLLSLTIIPSSITVDDFNMTGQFLAIATYSTAPYVRDVTNSPSTTWLSSEPELFPVDTNSGGNPGASAGLVTNYAGGGTVVIAETASADGTIQTASATYNCPVIPPAAATAGEPAQQGSCYAGEAPASGLLDTLTVYNEGLNTTDWTVTAPSATGTANVLHCGPGWSLATGSGGLGGSGGSVCTATYPDGATVVLTAPNTGAQFGGWSYNCTPTAPVTAVGPNSCTVTLTSNDTVGAIFN